MAAHDKASGSRLLDFLDIHFYYQGDTSANDDAAKALRLRMTRALWDPTYVDESWVGTSAPQNHQPNATIIQLIPRIQSLINQFYPGTKLSISEWNSQGDGDVTGGLGTADALGIFGRFGVDSATYWSDPDETSATALAYWLFNGYVDILFDLDVHLPYRLTLPATASSSATSVSRSMSRTSTPTCSVSTLRPRQPTRSPSSSSTRTQATQSLSTCPACRQASTLSATSVAKQVLPSGRYA